MGWRTSRVFPCLPTDAFEARRYIAACLAEQATVPRSAEVVEDVELIVSELVTNALNNDCGVLTVDLEVDPDQVEVAVADDGAGWPALQSPTLAAEHGRGLRIVAALASRWGVDRLPDGGKRVWAQLKVS